MIRRRLLALLLPLLAAAPAACGSDTPAGPDGGGGVGVDGGPPDAMIIDAVPPDARPPLEGTIEERLGQVTGLTFEEAPSQVEGWRLFLLTYDQPVDFRHPEGQHFTQRMTLLHYDLEAPTVLATDGYELFYYPNDYPEEPTWVLGANQLRVEHRFFSPSRPDPADWSLLTIRQAAADHHQILEAFRTVYHGNWISTGASKGGMTAVYHHRFYPDDVDGTVAYVAPLSLGAPDERYLAFFDTVGDATCRADVIAFQRLYLSRRQAMEELAQNEAIENGLTYDIVGGIGPAVEDAAVGFQWSYWQYGGVELCGDIPGPSASDNQIYDFMNEVGGPSGDSDAWIVAFEPYYVQAVAELGYPDAPLDDEVAGMMIYGGGATPLPDGANPVYDPGAMIDIQDWVTTEGSRILFVYGEADPWSAGAFAIGDATDTFEFFAPDANHGASIGALGGADQTVAYDALTRWSGRASSLRAHRPWTPPPRPPMLRPLPRVR